jgi:tetratricopeptide (TPR) repeat protein
MKTFQPIPGLLLSVVLWPAGVAAAQTALGDGTSLGTGRDLNANISTRLNPNGTWNPLGTGNALDANPEVNSGGFNRAGGGGYVGFDARNAIVTGNVAAGRGFRGSVGYTAEYDFRAPTGSNDLFRFQADSAYSSPQFGRLGSSFDQLRFGQDMAILEIPRADTGSAASRMVVPSFRSAEVLAARARIDRESMINTDVSVDTQVAPRMVGVSYTAEGEPLILNASSLRGLTAEPPQYTPSLAGLSLFDSARLRDDVKAGAVPSAIGQPFETRFESDDDIARVKPERAGEQVEPEAINDYDRILERIAERYARMKDVDLSAEPGQQKELDERYQELRKRLTGEAPLSEKEPSDRTSTEPPSAEPTEPVRKGLEDMLPPRDKERKKPPPVFSPDEFTEALRHGEHVETLSPENQTRFDELMSTAEQWLRQGQYFLAERRFERALRFTPGHPLATVGVAHSQIGSGLYLSAAATLRSLLARQPELIDVTYGPNVLPSRERLNENVATIQERLRGTKDLESYAFLLAYLGHQLDDRALVQQGLEAMEQIVPDDELLPMLWAIWLAEPDQDAPAPPSPAAPEK